MRVRLSLFVRMPKSINNHAKCMHLVLLYCLFVYYDLSVQLYSSDGNLFFCCAVDNENTLSFQIHSFLY